MKKFIAALFFTATLMGCGEKKYHVNLWIPEQVEIKKEGNYIQFPDTRIFIMMPEGYEFNVSGISSYVKKGKILIGDVKENNTNVEETKILYEIFLDSLHKEKNYALIEMQDFKLGDYEARYFQVRNYSSDMGIATLIFGDDKYSVTLNAVFPDADLHTEQEVMDILLTTYIDPMAQPDHTPFANYTIDLTGTKYKFNSFKKNEGLFINVYTVDGYDLEYTPEGNNFMIMEITDSTKSTAENRKEGAITIADEMSKDSLVNTFRQERFITINGEDAYEILTDKKYGDKKIKMETYLLCFNIGDKTFVLVGYMFTDFDTTINTYRNIVKTMKPKG
ncbi:MAG TPA: hypothetical protein VN698_04820 [Bacteroidia bacterium]|nr:hypothetical protein [Bacteroidia bacterium]